MLYLVSSVYCLVYMAKYNKLPLPLCNKIELGTLKIHIIW